MKLKQFIFALVAMLSGFAFTANAQTAVSSFDDLKAALANSTDIVVNGDIAVDEAITIPSGTSVAGDGTLRVQTKVYVVSTENPYPGVTYNKTATKNGSISGTASCAVVYEISLDGGENWFTDTTNGKAQAVTVKKDGTKTISTSFQSAFTSAKCGEIVHMLKDAHVQSTNTSKNNGPLRSYYGLILEGNGHTIYTDVESSGASNEYSTIKFTSYLAGTGADVRPVLKNVTIDSQKNAKADLDLVSGDVTFTVSLFNVNLLNNTANATLSFISGTAVVINKSIVKLFDSSIPKWDAGSANAIEFYSGDYSLSFNNKCKVYGGSFSKDAKSYLAERAEMNNVGGKYVVTCKEEKVEAAPSVGTTVEGEVANELVANEAVANNSVELPADVANFTVQLTDVESENEATTKVTFTVTPSNVLGEKVSTPTEAITFRLPLPAAWTGKAKVSHNGAELGVYDINEKNGAKYVEVTSASFSEFAVEPVSAAAKIGDVEYATLAAAVEAAQADDVITLIADVTLAEMVTIPANKTLTIDLNGKSISMEESIIATAYAINNLGNLTIEDGVGGGSINARGIYNGYGNGGANVASATITVLGGTFNAKGTNGGAAIFNYGTANVNGGTFTSIGGYSLNNQAGAKMNITDGVEVTGGIYNNQDAELTVDGGNISNNRSGCHTIYAWNSKVTVNGGSIHNENSGNATIMSAGTSEVTINGGTISIKDGRVPGNGNTWTSCLTDAANTAQIIVNGGTLNGGVRVQSGATMTINGGSFNDVCGSNYNIYGTVTVTGGTFTDATAKAFATKYVADGYEMGTDGAVAKKSIAAIGENKYESLEAAIADAQSGDEIVMLADATLDAETTLPAGVALNGNGKQINGNLVAGGNLTFVGHTKVTSFNAGYEKPVITIGAGACLEMNGSGRMVIGHGATFNITGFIADNAAKTTDKASLTPSLVMPGASFTGAGVTFNVTNAYIKAPSSYCSTSKSASGTFDFNIENSIWESAGKLAFEEQSVNANVDFALVNSVLTTGSHLVFGTASGEEGVVIDNSLVNEGASRQLENCGTMTIKNGSVVNGAVATSSNAKNPGTIIVENATYAVTGEFSGSDLGTGTLVVKNGAYVTIGSITKANIVIDAAEMTEGELANFTANLSKFAGELSVINNDKLEAQIVDGKIVLAAKPVAMIGDVEYADLQEAINAANGGTVTLVDDITYTTVYANNKTHWNGDLNYELSVGGNVTLDLNGHTIKSTGGSSHSYYALICVRSGSLTVVDSSEAKTGAIICSAETVAQRAYTIYNNGALTLNGGTVSNTVGNYAIESVTVKETALTINEGATVTSTGIAVRVCSQGSAGTQTVVINGGELNGTYAMWVPVKNGGSDIIDMTINGGTFTGSSNAILFNTYTNGDFTTDKIAITGGTFNGNVLIGADYESNTNNEALSAALAGKVISGGTFSNDVSEYVSKGYALEEGANGTFGVVEVPVAKIGEQGYATLQAAIDAAILMTGDVTIEIVAGTYAEDITLTNAAITAGDANARPNITFKPVEGNEVVLAGTVTLGYRQQNVGASMWNGEVTFEGIKFNHAENSKHSLDIQDVKGITLLNCTVTGDGEYGIGSNGSNATPKAAFTNCTFENGAMQVLGQLSANLVIDNSTFNNFSINAQGGTTPGLTIKNSIFNMTLTDAHVGQSFYVVRSNANPINIQNTKVNVDSEVSSVTADQAKWGLFWARQDANAKWNIDACEVNLTDAAMAQTELLFTKNAATTYDKAKERIVITNLTSASNNVADLVKRAEGCATVNGVNYKNGERDLTGMVAKVGDEYFATLIEAVAAVEDGGTVTLIADEIFTATNYSDNGGWKDGLYYVGDKSFTIDLGGFTIGQNGDLNDYLMNFKNVGSKDNTITIKNGTLDAGTTAYCALCTSSSHENQLTINTEDLNIINNISNGSTVKVRGGAVLNVNDGTVITGKNSYLGIECIASTVNINDGAEIYMNGTSSYNGCLVGVGSAGTVNVNGGYGKGVKGGFIAMTSGGTINVAGGEWIANTDGTVGNNSNYYILTAQSNKYESGFTGASIINVTGGTLRGGMDAWVLNNIEGEKAELNISGGNFNANPTRFVEEGYIATEADGIYTVVKATAMVGDVYYTSLEDAFKAATSGCTIEILSDVTVDYYWDARNTGAKFTVPVTINGNGKTIKFTNTVYDGGNYMSAFRFEADAVVNNLTIDMSEAISGFAGRFRAISAKANLTVDGCTFIGNGSTNNTRAIIFGEGATAIDQISITNSTFTGWRRGISDNESGKDVAANVTVTGNTLTDAAVYVSATTDVTFTGNTVAGAYVNIKSYTAGNKLAVTATGNTLEANTETAYNVIDAGGVVNAEGFKVVAKGGSMIGYTSTEGIYGEVWGNSRESFVIKVVDAQGNVMGTTSLNNVGGIIDGDVYVTWNIKFNAAANTDEYWTMAWTTAPSIDNMPAKVQLWVDGTNVSEGDVVLNGPDNLWPIAVAVTDAEGNILSCHETIAAAVAANATNIALLRNTDEVIKLPLGVTLDKNGFTADGVTVTLPVAKIGEHNFASVNDALAYAKEAGLTNLEITIIGTNDASTTDSFDLVYATLFDNVTIKQDNGGVAYYINELYTGSRTNAGQFVFDGVNIVVTGQYMFEGNVKLSNNSLIKSVAEANCFVYNAEVTVEAGSKIDGVIEDIRGGSLIIDGGKTDGTYCETPGLLDAILAVNWTDSKLVLKNGAYVKVNAANEVGRLTVKGTLDVTDSKLDAYQWINVNKDATMNLNAGSVVTTKKVEGAGKITVDATGLEGTVTVINGDMAGFTGAIEVVGNDYAKYEITEAGLVINSSYIAELTLVDGKEFRNDSEKTVGKLTYVRTLPAAGIWYPVFLPFDVPVGALAENFDVARINDLHTNFSEEDGSVEKMWIEYIVKKSGTLAAGKPFLVRAKNSANLEMSIVLEEVKLYPASKKSTITVSSAITKVTFEGVYEVINSPVSTPSTRYMAVNADGVWDEFYGYSLNPFRVMMTLEILDEDYYINSTASLSVGSRVVGEENEDGTTTIYDVFVDRENDGTIYDLQGRKVLEITEPGIYIINGKKVLVK